MHYQLNNFIIIYNKFDKLINLFSCNEFVHMKIHKSERASRIASVLSPPN